jgi:uncharacterized protein YjeT (DUF2065 family)
MKETNMFGRRVKELCAMTMIGDGLLGLVEPQEHVLLWSSGPKRWEQLMRRIAQYPGTLRVLGAMELFAGLMLAHRQYSNGGQYLETSRLPAQRSAGREAAREVSL